MKASFVTLIADKFPERANPDVTFRSVTVNSLIVAPVATFKLAPVPPISYLVFA